MNNKQAITSMYKWAQSAIQANKQTQQWRFQGSENVWGDDGLTDRNQKSRGGSGRVLGSGQQPPLHQLGVARLEPSQ